MSGKLIALLACALVVIGTAAVVVWAPWRTTAPAKSVRYLGVYEADSPTSYAGVEQFAQAIGRQPNLVTYYSHWLDPFRTSFATSAAQHGATTLVQIAPQNIQLTDITAGRYDPYLTSYAAAVKEFGKPVVLSFGHEMNGDWYSWGYGQTSPATFVAAWRHVVTVFREEGAYNVTWLWTVNQEGRKGTQPIRAWWPGASYVTWVGIDGYYVKPSDSFNSVFGSTISQVQALTGKPILLSETGVSPKVNGKRFGDITQIFNHVQSQNLLGVVWFDEAQPAHGLYRQNWQIEGSSQAQIAFQQGISELKIAHT